MLLLGVAAIVVLTVVAYLPALGAGFIWDDDQYVTHNVLLHDVEGLRRIWLVPRDTPQYYPAVFTSFWIEHKLWGFNPRGYHATNILLHALNAILVWMLARRLRIPGAWLIGAVFALHPVHVESVAWITERKNVLSGCFYLLAALAYLRFDDTPGIDPSEYEGIRKSNRWFWYSAALVLFMLALLSKTVTCSLPAALILMMLWQRKRLTLARLAPLVPMFALGLVLALHTAMLERDHVLAHGPDFDFTLPERVLIASNALLFYPMKLLWPHPLIFIYPRWIIDAGELVSYWALAVVLIVAAAGVIAFARGGGGRSWEGRSWGGRGAPLALAFYAGTIFPALGFFNIYPMIFSFVADHFQYLASLGIIALVIGTIVKRLGDEPVRLASLGLVVLPILMALTWRQASIYQSPYTLWNDTLSKNEKAWIAHNNIAPILIAQSENERRSDRAATAAALVRAAREHAETAVALKGDHPPSLSNYSETLRYEGRYEEALAPLHKAIELVPDDPNYRWQAGRLHELLHRLFQAAEGYRAAVVMDPSSMLYRSSLARLLLQRSGQAEAQHHMSVLLEQARDERRAPAPTDPMMLEALAVALHRAGDAGQAAEMFEAAAHLAERLALPERARDLRARAAASRAQ